MLSMYSNLAKQYVSSTNLFHSFTLLLKYGITDVSSSAMNMFASAGPNSEPIYLNVSFIIEYKMNIFSFNLIILFVKTLSKFTFFIKNSIKVLFMYRENIVKV